MNDPSSTARAPDRVEASRSGILDRCFRPVGVPHEAPTELAALAQRGSIVFVMRSAGILNFLYLAWLARRYRLPVLRAALGLRGLLAWIAGVRPTAAALEEAIARRETSIVFLRRASGPDPFPMLVALQRRVQQPILLVPALLVWTRRPQKLKPTAGDLLFGTPDAPSRLANAIGFVLNHRRAVLRLGAASDLSTFVAERAGEPEAVLGRKLRGALHFHLAQQVRAVVGPPLKRPARVREQVLRDRSLRAVLERQARETGRPISDLQRDAERCLEEIASRYSPAFVEILRPIIHRILRRLYEAIDVDEPGLAHVKRAAADAPIVLCPSHKSHIDYLVLSLLLYDRGMTPPHIAAGINLAFWPFGAIARRGGAFFIRRSLRGNRIYSATLRAYIKQLLRDRFPQEFYLEGGRSRSGKLLFPKTGLFSMEVDAWLEEAAPDVLFVPVAIDYEVLIEGSSYARELAGAEKEKEDVRGLLRAGKALGRRYGRLTVQFDEPISLRAFARQRLGSGAASLTLDEEPEPTSAAATTSESPGAESKRQLVQALANRVAFGINRVSTVTAVGLVATALLSNLRRGLTAAELEHRVELLGSMAADRGARFAHGLAGTPADPLAPGPIAGAVARLAGEGLIRIERAAGETIYQPVDDRRPLLDYHKNAVISRFVPLSLVAVALRASGGDAPVEDVRARTRWLSRLFKLEFMYRVGASFDEIFADDVRYLGRIDLVREESARLVAVDRAALELVANILRPYLEAYRLTFEALLAADHANPSGGIERRAVVKAALEHGRAAYAAGHVGMRESLSKATMENAAEWFFQQGALVPVEGGRARLAASWREKKLAEIITEIETALRA